MTLFVLDTDTVSLLQHGDLMVTRRVMQVDPAQIAIAVITAEEQLLGRLTAMRQARGSAAIVRAYDALAQTVQSLGRLRILAFTEAAIARFEALKALKLNIGTQDLRIAAIALEHNAVVVTRNARDFGRIPNLVTEDWSR